METLKNRKFDMYIQYVHMYLYEKIMKQKSIIAFKNLLFGRISEFRRHPEHEFR